MYLLRQVQSQKPAPLTRPSTSLQGKQIHMYGLEYGPLTICYHTRVQVSVSMYADTMNMIHTSQKSTKEGLNEDIEGGFRNPKEKYLVNK